MHAYEPPDAITAASVSTTLGASGAALSVETIQLFTIEEAMTAMTKGPSGNYRIDF